MLLLLLTAVGLANPVQTRLDALEAVRGQRLARSAPAIPPEAYEQAAAGKVQTGLVDVPGHKARMAWGVGVVDQPIARYWAAINDDRNKVQYTKLDYLELLDGDFCGAKRKVFQYLGVSLLTDRWWVVEQRMNTALSAATSGAVREMTWRSIDTPPALSGKSREWADQGMQIAFSEGAWLLLDLLDGRTMVEYYAWSDPGGSVPARMASSFAAGGISETIESMGQLAAAGPSCL